MYRSLPCAAYRQRSCRHILGQRGACTDRRATADLDRCDQLAIRPDKGIILDNRPVLVGTIVIAGDRACTDIDPAADGGITDIGQMIRLALGSDMAVLDFDEIADMHFFAQISPRNRA